MIYLIGGAPRVGKTTLANHLVQRHPMHAVSTDAIRYMLRHSVPKEALDPDIFIRFHEDVMGEWKLQPHETTLDEQNRQSRAYWQAIKALLESYDEDGVDVIVEGVAILPEFADSLKLPARSIFLGDTYGAHAEMVRTQARRNEHDWMHGYSDEELASAVEFFKFMSEHIKKEAARYDLTYLEISDADHGTDLSRATDFLLDSSQNA